jgi:hypothetical protein
LPASAVIACLGMMYWVNTFNLLINLSGTLFAFLLAILKLKRAGRFRLALLF